MAGLYSRENMLDAVIEHAKDTLLNILMNVEVYSSMWLARRAS